MKMDTQRVIAILQDKRTEWLGIWTAVAQRWEFKRLHTATKACTGPNLQQASPTKSDGPSGIPTELGANRSEDHKSGIARDYVAIAEQAFEFSLIAEVTVADNPNLAAPPQYVTRFRKHLQRHGIADGVVFVERRIVEHSVDAALPGGNALG
jgi:hypothetical protein